MLNLVYMQASDYIFYGIASASLFSCLVTKTDKLFYRIMIGSSLRCVQVRLVEAMKSRDVRNGR